MESKPSTSHGSICKKSNLTEDEPLNKKAKKDTKNRGIEGNARGINYHYSVAMFLCLEGHRQKESNPEYEYRLQQEVGEASAGKFDDLVYVYRNKQNEQWTRVFVQIKNKKSENMIKTSNLLFDGKNEMYSLHQYINTTKNIQYTDNCYYVIYTNADFDIEDSGYLRKWYKKETNEEISLLPLKLPKIPIFDTKSQYTFDNETNLTIFCNHSSIAKEAWKQFLSKLVFVVGQLNLEKINSRIEEKIGNILPKITEIIRCRLLDKINYSLCNQTEITSKEISDLIENAQKEIQSYHDNKYEESKLDFDINVPLYNFFISKKMILPIKSNNLEFTKYNVCKEIKKLRNNKNDVNKYTMKHVYSIKQVTDIENATIFTLLIIVINNSDQLNCFKYIPKKNDQKYILIILDDLIIPEMQNCYPVFEDIENNFKKLSVESKKYVLEEECIIFNQQNTNFGKILKIDSNTLTEEQENRLNVVMTEDVLSCFIKEDYNDLNINFNHCSNNNLDFYIDRQFYCRGMIDECALLKCDELYIIDDFNTYITQCAENPDTTIHYFISYDLFYFLWIETNGDSTNMRNLINKNRFTLDKINEDDLCSLTTNTIIISDKPGMGKTSLLRNVLNKLQSKYATSIIIRLDLNNYTNLFSKNPVFNNSEDTKHFLINELLDAKHSVLTKNIFNFVLENENMNDIILLLDAFDEICPDYKDIASTFIKSLIKLNKFMLFVTTRPTQKASLEKIMSTSSFTMIPFTEKCRNLYLNNKLKTNNIVKTKVLENINENIILEKLLGAPLLLKIFTDIVNDHNILNEGELNIKQIFKLSELFNTFVKQKFQIYSEEKKKQDTTNPSVKRDDEELHKSYKEKHENLALRLLFNEETETIDDASKEQITKIGIIIEVVQQRAEFIHLTFAEYFVSTFIKKHFNEKRVMELLFWDVLIENDLSLLRQFINNYILDELKDENTAAKYRLFINKNLENIDVKNILLTAIEENNSETIKFILQYQTIVDVNTVIFQYQTDVHLNELIENNSLTALFIAAENPYLEADVLHALLDAGAEIDKANTDDNTALYCAVGNNYIDVVRVLLDGGANVNRCGMYGGTPLYRAADEGYTEMVDVLLSNGANVNKTSRFDETPLHRASIEGHTEVVRLLLKKGADMNLASTNGGRAIHYAASAGHIKVLQELLEKGTKVNITSTDGDTALHTAASARQIEVVRYLLEKGADVDIVNDNGKTPLHCATFNSKIDIMNILIDNGTSVNTVNSDGNTALHCAAERGAIEAVRTLLSRDAVDVNITNNDGNTALHCAIRRIYAVIVHELLNAASRSTDVDIVNNRSETALHAAVIEGHTGIVKELLEHNVDVNITNIDGDKALQLAYKTSNMRLVQLLLRHGNDMYDYGESDSDN